MHTYILFNIANIYKWKIKQTKRQLLRVQVV